MFVFVFGAMYRKCLLERIERNAATKRIVYEVSFRNRGSCEKGGFPDYELDGLCDCGETSNDNVEREITLKKTR